MTRQIQYRGLKRTRQNQADTRYRIKRVRQNQTEFRGLKRTRQDQTDTR